MKDKCFIYYGNPCTVCLTDAGIRAFEDAQRHGPRPCPFLSEGEKCSPPRFGCVAVAGAKMARCVLQFYTQASEETLALDREFFWRRGPLPPKDVEAYIDAAEYGYRRIYDPNLVVERVWEYARAASTWKRQSGSHVPRGASCLRGRRYSPSSSARGRDERRRRRLGRSPSRLFALEPGDSCWGTAWHRPQRASDPPSPRRACSSSGDRSPD